MVDLLNLVAEFLLFLRGVEQTADVNLLLNDVVFFLFQRSVSDINDGHHFESVEVLFLLEERMTNKFFPGKSLIGIDFQ